MSFSWLPRWLGGRRPAKPSFKVGDTVYDSWDQRCTVIRIDPRAGHGLGAIWTRRDSDGVELGHGFEAHDLTREPKRRAGGGRKNGQASG